MRPVLRYHGGKHKLAPWVLEHFPPHEIYVEPFCGAASVLLAKPRCRAEVINDLDDQIVTLFRVLRDAGAAARLQRRLELTPFSRTEFRAAYEPTDDPVEASARFIIRSFQGHGSGGGRGYRTGFRLSVHTHVPSRDWSTYSSAIPEFVERLQGVTIENKDALKLIDKTDGSQTLFYCDPPYVSATRYRDDKWGYRHEMTSAEHEELSEVLHELEGMVVLSGYPSALYDRLYAGWEQHSIDAHADRGSPRTEVLYLNPAASSAQRQMRMFA